MKQNFTPPTTGLVLEVGSGENPHPRSNVLVDRFLLDNTERGGDIKRDGRPLVVADAHHLPFRDGAFEYIICSHILEHMDDPQQFVQELQRTGKAGYIGSPSEIAERMFHWAFHRWYVNLLDDGTLVLHPKEPAEPFGELFDYLYEYNPMYYLFQRSMPHLFWVEHEWRGQIKLRMADESPLALRDPQALQKLIAPRFGAAQLATMFIGALASRVLRRGGRETLRKVLGRSYV
ncbi:MAG: class I SAM-dependent methyltransferase [Chloroflexaceae bacterium]|nr:class I SAM-dependent methyltransferase [Chloroflexaceae bacterium]